MATSISSYSGSDRGVVFDPAALPYIEWKLLLDLSQRHLRKFTSLLRTVLEQHEITRVHKLRATSRRLEQVLPLIYSDEAPDYVRELSRRTKKCRRALSDLADCQMVLHRAKRAVMRDPSVSPSTWQMIMNFITVQRDAMLPHVLEKLKRLDYSAWALRFQRDVEEHQTHVYFEGGFRNVSPGRAREVLEDRLAGALSETWMEFATLVRESHRDSSQIHAVRIATKHLRNVLEVMDKVGVEGSRQALDWICEVQEVTGEWRDLEVMECLTRGLVEQEIYPGDCLPAAPEIHKVLLANREIMKRAEERFREITLSVGACEATRAWVSAFGNVPRSQRTPAHRGLTVF